MATKADSRSGRHSSKNYDKILPGSREESKRRREPLPHGHRFIQVWTDDKGGQHRTRALALKQCSPGILPILERGRTDVWNGV